MKSKIFIILMIALTAGTVSAQSGGSLGMAGAYTTLARGSEALYWNPANLAFQNEGKPAFSMTLYSFNLAITNNAFNMDDYETYFTDENKVLSEGEKSDIISKVPSGGLELDMRTDLEVFSMAYKNFAFSYSLYGSSEIKAPQALFENAFTGIEQRRYDYSTTGDGEFVSSLNFAYGRTVWRDISFVIPYIEYPMTLTEVALGGSFSYNLGMFAFVTEQADFYTEMSDDGLRAFAHFRGTGSGLKRVLKPQNEWDDPLEPEYEIEYDEDNTITGSGFGINFAVSAKTDKDYVLSLVLKNIYNKTTWDKSALMIDRMYDTGSDPLFLVGAGQLEDLDSDEIETDNDHSIGSFQTTRPFGFRLGASREMGRYIYSSEMGWEDEEFVFALGGAYKWSVLNFYGGYGFKFGHSFNFGFGIGGEHAMFDIGMGTHNGITPGGTKGVLIASSFRFGF